MKKQTFLLGFILIPFIIACGEGDEHQAKHNQGKNCLECHSFTSGGTIFKHIDAKNYDELDAAQGFMIQLLLESGKTVRYTKGNGYGNVLYNGDQGAIDNFTAQIISNQGEVVNQSGKNSHNVGRLACNRCHTQEGLNGAPGRIVNFDINHNISSEFNQTTPISQSNKKSFSKDVMPILKTCTSCHGNSGNYSVTNTQGTFENITSNKLIDTATPSQSRLLLKATQSISHGGGQRFDTSSQAYNTILIWINEGAKNN